LNHIESEDEILEIGLGFGTLGNYLFDKCKKYTGIDISEEPVSMMKKRIENSYNTSTCTSLIGNGTNLIFKDNSFDVVISIGVLHHTGNLKKSISEVYRVLKPNGKLIMMIYRKPNVLNFFYMFLALLKNNPKKIIEYQFNFMKLFRYIYDHDQNDNSAPFTDFTSKKELGHLLEKFNSSKIKVENHTLSIFRKKNLFLKNKVFLDLFGCDLYSVSIK
jgi:ubiquinone/menaquinone biosynthesis C-methylase UbiE